MQGECLSSTPMTRIHITKEQKGYHHKGVKLLELEVWGLFKGQHLLIRTKEIRIRLQNGEPTKTTNLVTSSNKQVVTCTVLHLDSSPLCSKSNYSYEHSKLKTYYLQMARVHTEGKVEVENSSNF
jgi:hypothetical protein